MRRALLRQFAIWVAAWLPFFVLWTAVAMSSGQITLGAALIGGFMTMGSAGALGVFVWFACRRWPWPLGFRLRFYALQIALAVLYGVVWTALVFALEWLRGTNVDWSLVIWGRQALLGVWFLIGGRGSGGFFGEGSSQMIGYAAVIGAALSWAA